MSDKKPNQKELKNITVAMPAEVKCEIGLDTIVFEKNGKKIDFKYNPVYVLLNKTKEGIELVSKDKKKRTKAVVNSTEKHIINAIKGLDKEYTYKLTIVYSHFPITVKVEGTEVVVSNFLGEKKPRKTRILPGCKVEIKGRDIFVKGNDKYKTGQTAGNIEKVTRVIGRDFRIFDDGCYIVEKAKQE